ncbi:MAG TPA: HAMP domain-containing sensor histidine kinase [Candidatus Saccharimonadales bacterium]|nr:HAMP domain-containing sensor histidine kinase [Candidatus Saccharimonadales bacterium]
MSMTGRLYNLFIAPKQTDEDTRNREIVLNVLLAGTVIMLLLALPMALFSFLVLDHRYALMGVISVVVSLFAVAGLYALARAGYYRLAACLLVGIYFLLAFDVVYKWGVTIPAGVLLNGFVIVLAGILLGSYYSLYVVAAIALLQIILQNLADRQVIHPDWSWVNSRPSMVDVLSFSLIYGLIALVIWLFNVQMGRSLRRARRAETALTRQKNSLQSEVARQTKQLQAIQLEKVQQLYRFAELGQISTHLLHDMTNHLATITLDIEDLEAESRSRVVQRTKRSIRYIDDMVSSVRDQLQGRTARRPFNVATELQKIFRMLSHKASQQRVTLTWQGHNNRRMLRCLGDPTKFRQMLTNLISNAIDAYDDAGTYERREVLVTAGLAINKNFLKITVEDWGRGITPEQRVRLFEPFHSTKQSGMGMGLFIARQIAEQDFNGGVTIDTNKTHTSFMVRLQKV